MIGKEDSEMLGNEKMVENKTTYENKAFITIKELMKH